MHGCFPAAAGALAHGATSDEGLAGLVHAIARGDEKALAALYDRTHRWVHGLCLRIPS